LWTAAAVLGLGGGALNGATNTLMADLHEDPQRKNAALNLMGVFFGFGALLAPFAMGALLRRAPLEAILAGAAVVCACSGVYASLFHFPAPKAPQRLPFAEMPAMLRAPIVPLLAAALFFQSGNEFLLGGYLSSLFQRELLAAPDQASWALAGVWASVMAARVFFSRYLLRADAYRVVLWSAALSAAAAAGVALVPGFAAATLIAAALGAAMSAIFPTILGIAGARFQERSGTVFGILFTVALSGGMSVPWIAGHLAEACGLRAAFWLAAGGCACTWALTALARRRRES
jgi:fucose permease